MKILLSMENDDDFEVQNFGVESNWLVKSDSAKTVENLLSFEEYY